MFEVVLQSLILVSVEAVCCKIFIEIFVRKKEYLSEAVMRTVIVVFAAGFEFITLIGINNILLKCVLALLMITAVIRAYYKSKLLQSMFLAGIYYGILLCIDYFSFLIIKYMLPERYDSILYAPLTSTLLVLLCKVVLFILVLTVKKSWNPSDELNMISDAEWIRFAYFPILTIVVIFSMLINLNYSDSEKSKNTLLVIAFGLVIMNLVVFYLIRDILTSEMKTRNIRLIQERTRNQMKIYRRMSESYDEQKRKVHEYKNQISCIQGMLLDGEQEEALKYVTNLLGGLIRDVDTIRTNHVVADAILNQKYRCAVNQGIALTMQINDLAHVAIEEEDLVIILSNLLDNAIEACARLDKDRVIVFKFLDKPDEIIISVRNPVKEPVKIADNRIVSTKEEKEVHGIGLLNIQSSVRKYDGTGVIQCRDGYFTYSAVIPKTDTHFN